MRGSEKCNRSNTVEVKVGLARRVTSSDIFAVSGEREETGYVRGGKEREIDDSVSASSRVFS